MDPIIREYTKEDLYEVLNLFRLNVPQYFSIEEENDLLNYLSNKIDTYFVMIGNNKIIGSGGINYPDQSIAKISWDIIHPHYHRQGLGLKLLNHRLNMLKNKDLNQIIVRTSQQAYKFYEKAGFKLIEVNKDYWSAGFDLYLMEYSF